MDDCPPVLIPFLVDRLYENGLTYSDGKEMTETRKVEVDYVDNRFSLGPTLWLEGVVVMTNLREVRALVRYRNAVPLDPWFFAEIPDGSPACLEGNRVVGYWEAAIDPGETVTVPLAWSVPVFDLADLDRSGYVDAVDLGFFLAEWGSDDSPADFNADGVVDGIDLGLFFERWTG